MSLNITRKLNKLNRVFQKRGVIGCFQFLYQRSWEKLQHQRHYNYWVCETQLTDEMIRAAIEEINTWQWQPKFSIIMPVYNVEAKWLGQAIESVRNQLYDRWELCIADDASSKPHIHAILTYYSQIDPRIKVVFRSENGNISAASNSALELVTGEYIVLLDHDDELTIDALFENAKLLNQFPGADFIYSDEDKIDRNGRRYQPVFKPNWSPEYFHSTMYTCHLAVFRASLVRGIQGFRLGYEGSQDYDLVLRVIERTKQIYHIPKILYHWRSIAASAAAGAEAKPWAYVAGRKALESMLTRNSIAGQVEETPAPGFYCIRQTLPDRPLISIILASHSANSKSISKCFEQIEQCSSEHNFEVLHVNQFPPKLSSSKQLKLILSSEPQNIAQEINQAAKAAEGEFLLLLDPALQIHQPDWLTLMLQFVQQSDIGAVSAKILSATDKIQHIGIVLVDGVPKNIFYGYDRDHAGYSGSNLANRNYLAVSGRCLMIRRNLFEQFDGMDEKLPFFSDVDLCLKAHQAGYRHVVTPFVELIEQQQVFHQTGSLISTELESFRQKWQSYLHQLGGDPYYNPNLFAHKTLFPVTNRLG
jgi:glycosyltransferase involved in cell wall biosynthesis